MPGRQGTADDFFVGEAGIFFGEAPAGTVFVEEADSFFGDVAVTFFGEEVGDFVDAGTLVTASSSVAFVRFGDIGTAMKTS